VDEKLQPIFEGILDGQARAVTGAVGAALDAGLDPALILNDGMIAAMAEVGRRFEDGRYFVPEMMIAARAMQAGLERLKPHLGQANAPSAGRVAIGTVKGDLHNIGKNLVAMLLEGAGFEVIDLSVDVSPEAFVEAVQQYRPAILGMSALLTTTMVHIETTIQALEAAGLRDHVRVIIGGAPVTEAFAQAVGADGYAPDASRAVTLAKSLVKAQRN
jgi:5-methyltetrahydrofolate--homocysteine methyltransferase